MNITFANTKGDRLVGILHNPLQRTDVPIIILVHGHSSSKNNNSLVLLSEMLGEKGIATLRIDLYGHGESEGNFEDATVSEAVDSILAAIRYVKEQGYNKVGLLGSSYGGMASIMAASQTHDLFVLVLKSPVSSYINLYEWKATPIQSWKEKGFKPYKTRHGMAKLRYSFYEDAVKQDGYAAAAKITVPTLIVHGDADEEVPLEQSNKLVSYLPQGKLYIVPGADHRYTNDIHAKQMREKVVAFICERINE